MKTIMVIGAGFMGAGIAQVCIQKSYRVILSDEKKSILDKAEESISWSLEKLFQKGVIKEEPEQVLERLSKIREIEAAQEASIVIEAVFEDETLKKNILTKLEPLIKKTTMVATNTSSIPITRLGSCLKFPERFLGLHFFGPVPFMGLVEVVKGKKTSDKFFTAGMDFIKTLKKHPVAVKKDIPGFVMNRVFAAAFRECQELVSKGIATPEDIDTGMRLGYGWNKGPFQIADNAGLDTIARIEKSMKSLKEDHLYSDSGLVDTMVAKGKLGKKSLNGFYRYDSQTNLKKNN